MSETRPPTQVRRTALAPDVRRLDERAARAWTERMAVRPLGGGRYAVDSASGATYVVDLPAGTCTCPDHQIRGERCKHLRRVGIEITTRRVPAPGKRAAVCDACGIDTFVPEDEGPPDLCPACRLEPGDVVSDRETDDRLVVARVTPERAYDAVIEGVGETVADYATNEGYPADDPVVEAVYLGDLARRESPRRYSFPLSRLERVDDAAVVDRKLRERVTA
ncbi:SWIM zinc finger family protein [Halosimplex rubrum]|uniref:SWIM zinc finger family protein n=1 Tax=Halosimplex rubrum TaxID=869889 RepID=A0A7D5P327_9EURY|nr:SWIM zinc finger family protein [Halosimplex rubrum]QLH76265.1 SWIM zinc finger family protein [Halosimplex rubrum]